MNNINKIIYVSILSSILLTGCASWDDPRMSIEQKLKIREEYRLKAWENREYWRRE